MDKLLASTLALLLLLFSAGAYPAVYKCKNENGQMVFSDKPSACNKSQHRDSATPVVPAPEPTIPRAVVEKPTSHANPEDSGKDQEAGLATEQAQVPPADSDRHSNGGFKEKLGLVLLVIGAIISLVYSVILLVVTFRVSVWWGLGSIFVPFVGLIFLVVHWQEAKSPFLKSLWALPFLALGILLNPGLLMELAEGEGDSPATLANPPTINTQ